MKTIKTTDLDKMPSRMKSYLLDWKHTNKEEWFNKYGNKKLFDFNTKELYDIFKYATERDYSIFSLFGKF